MKVWISEIELFGVKTKKWAHICIIAGIIGEGLLLIGEYATKEWLLGAPPTGWNI